MNEFDLKARLWDSDPMHIERADTIARQILDLISVIPSMDALEFGAGTGLTSFFLKDSFREITMMDNSPEMVKIMNEKIASTASVNLKALLHDLEKQDYPEKKFDVVISQMVLHHVTSVETIIRRFHRLLYPGGYLAIADLCTEDGTFHGSSFSGHKGFDPEQLSFLIRQNGFTDTNCHFSYIIKKKIAEAEIRPFNVFLLTARKQ